MQIANGNGEPSKVEYTEDHLHYLMRTQRKPNANPMQIRHKTNAKIRSVILNTNMLYYIDWYCEVVAFGERQQYNLNDRYGLENLYIFCVAYASFFLLFI